MGAFGSKGPIIYIDRMAGCLQKAETPPQELVAAGVTHKAWDQFVAAFNMDLAANFKIKMAMLESLVRALNVGNVSGNKSKLHEAIEHEVESFVPELKPSSGPNDIGDRSACTITANAAEEMFNKCKRLSKKRKKTLLLAPIGPHSPHLTPPLTTHPTPTPHPSRHR